MHYITNIKRNENGSNDITDSDGIIYLNCWLKSYSEIDELYFLNLIKLIHEMKHPIKTNKPDVVRFLYQNTDHHEN